MGEYYNWVNVDRKEYICPADFDLGNKLLESSTPHNAFLCAFRELLANEWRGSHVVFLGDSQALTRDEDNATLKTLYDHSVESGYEGVGIDTVVESYKNISGWFSAAEKEVRREIDFYVRDVKNGEPGAFNEYKVDINNPYTGLFTRTGKDYIYTLNHTKKQYYSIEDTVINMPRKGVIYDPDKPEGKRFSKQPKHFKLSADPLPYLLRHGYYGIGEWVGDIVGVSDEVPEGYILMNEIVIDN